MTDDQRRHSGRGGDRPERGLVTRSDLEAVKESLKGIVESFREKTVAIEVRIAEVRTDVAAADTLLRGNGSEGMSQRLMLVNDRVMALGAEVKALKDKNDKLVWWLIGLLVTVIATLVTAIVK